MNFFKDYPKYRPKPITEDDIPCNWEGPRPSPSIPGHRCSRRARYFYTDVEDKLCCRCYEHRHGPVKQILSKDEVLVQILMDV